MRSAISSVRRSRPSEFSMTWPPSDPERVSNCPVCGSPERKARRDHPTDRVFFCPPRTWTLYAYRECGSVNRDSRPTSANIGRAYAEYDAQVKKDAAPHLATDGCVAAKGRALGHRLECYGAKVSVHDRILVRAPDPRVRLIYGDSGLITAPIVKMQGGKP